MWFFARPRILQARLADGKFSNFLEQSMFSGSTRSFRPRELSSVTVRRKCAPLWRRRNIMQSRVNLDNLKIVQMGVRQQIAGRFAPLACSFDILQRHEFQAEPALTCATAEISAFRLCIRCRLAWKMSIYIRYHVCLFLRSWWRWVASTAVISIDVRESRGRKSDLGNRRYLGWTLILINGHHFSPEIFLFILT